VVLLVVALRVLPSSTARFERKIDLAGLAMLIVSVLLFVVPMLHGHEQDWPLWRGSRWTPA
jgi:multisubunit Na+/H+ antiporter MnhB subunit